MLEIHRAQTCGLGIMGGESRIKYSLLILNASLRKVIRYECVHLICSAACRTGGRKLCTMENGPGVKIFSRTTKNVHRNESNAYTPLHMAVKLQHRIDPPMNLTSNNTRFHSNRSIHCRIFFYLLRFQWCASNKILFAVSFLSAFSWISVPSHYSVVVDMITLYSGCLLMNFFKDCLMLEVWMSAAVSVTIDLVCNVLNSSFFTKFSRLFSWPWWFSVAHLILSWWIGFGRHHL